MNKERVLENLRNSSEQQRQRVAECDLKPKPANCRCLCKLPSYAVSSQDCLSPLSQNCTLTAIPKLFIAKFSWFSQVLIETVTLPDFRDTSLHNFLPLFWSLQFCFYWTPFLLRLCFSILLFSFSSGLFRKTFPMIQCIALFIGLLYANKHEISPRMWLWCASHHLVKGTQLNTYDIFEGPEMKHREHGFWEGCFYIFSLGRHHLNTSPPYL